MPKATLKGKFALFVLGYEPSSGKDELQKLSQPSFWINAVMKALEAVVVLVAVGYIINLAIMVIQAHSYGIPLDWPYLLVHPLGNPVADYVNGVMNTPCQPDSITNGFTP